KRLIWGRSWFEAVVEGEVTVEVVAADEPLQEPRPVSGWGSEGVPGEAADGLGGLAGGASRGDRKRSARRRGDEVTIELEALADLVAHLLSRRSDGLDAGRQPVHEAGRPLPRETWPDEALVEKKLEEIVRRVLRQYDGEKRDSAGEAATLASLPLEQIPSRPGLYRSFAQSVPPPKPHSGASGGEGVKPASWSDVCSLLKNIPAQDPEQRGRGEQG
ncbi:MAG: hypothetical protein ACPLTR_09015, partial [Thermacetogeniaceae bacterium]